MHVQSLEHQAPALMIDTFLRLEERALPLSFLVRALGDGVAVGVDESPEREREGEDLVWNLECGI